MASIMSSTLLAGKKIQDSQGADSFLSKVVQLDSKNRLFFHMFPMDDGSYGLIAPMVPGRSLDFDVFKSTFVVLPDNEYSMTDSGEVVDRSGLDRFARIARVIHKAKCTKLKRDKEKEAEESAANLGMAINQADLAKTLEAIDLDYNGGEAANGQPIYPKYQPAISGLKNKMVTQLVIVPLNADGSPNVKEAKTCMLELSRAKTTQLLTILENNAYRTGDPEWLEVEYDYVGADKKTAGQAAKFQGISHEMKLEVNFPEQYEAIKKVLDTAVKSPTLEATAEAVANRDMNIKRSKTPQEISLMFKKWCATNASIFTAIDYDDEYTKQAAKDFLESSLVDMMPTVRAKFETLANEAEESASTDETATEEQKSDQEALQAAEAVKSVSPTLASINQAAPNVKLSSDDDDDDIGMLSI